MLDVIFDSLLDTVKILPFLFLAFLILEFVEHKLTKKNEKILEKNKKLGPIFGGILGAVPQCGFSAMAANLFSNRVITIGTLVAIFLSTSDEMLPIMLSEGADFGLIFGIILSKVVIGVVVGLVVDLVQTMEEVNRWFFDEGMEKGKNEGRFDAFFSLVSKKMLSATDAAAELQISAGQFLEKMQESGYSVSQ